MTVITQFDPPIARIQLNAPNTLNALNLSMGKIIQDVLSDIEANPAIKVVILESIVDKAFSVGIDLKEFYIRNTQEYREEFLEIWNSVSLFPKPIVVSLHGYTFGGGLELALMGDVLIAADNTIFAQPELSVGTIPGLGATQKLPNRIGVSRAKDMIFTGRRIDARRALEWGLVSQVVTVDQLIQTTLDTANIIAAKSLPALIRAKMALRKSEECTLIPGLRNERGLFLSTFELADQQEGFQAFLQKRPPLFKDK